MEADEQTSLYHAYKSSASSSKSSVSVLLSRDFGVESLVSLFLIYSLLSTVISLSQAYHPLYGCVPDFTGNVVCVSPAVNQVGPSLSSHASSLWTALCSSVSLLPPREFTQGPVGTTQAEGRQTPVERSDTACVCLTTVSRDEFEQ